MDSKLISKQSIDLPKDFKSEMSVDVQNGTYYQVERVKSDDIKMPDEKLI